jgi:hypothetical protein
MNKKASFKSWLPWIVATIAVIIIFHISYGLSALQPSNVSWLMTVRHDWGTHYLGWAFYKNEPWQFPLGKVDGYNFPVGTNVGYTDSIPLLAIFFKVFAPLLSSDFQYFGIWLFLCHLLAAYFYYSIAQGIQYQLGCYYSRLRFYRCQPGTSISWHASGFVRALDANRLYLFLFPGQTIFQLEKNSFVSIPPGIIQRNHQSLPLCYGDRVFIRHPGETMFL